MLTTRSIWPLGAVLLIASTAAFGAKGVRTSFSVPGAPGPPLTRLADNEPPADPQYLLGPDDEVLVQVLEADEFSDNALRIGTDGLVSLPLIGRVKAAGRTTDELETAIAAKLKTFMLDPQVVISIAEFRSQPVSVLGEVMHPGVHQAEGRKTLVEMLSLAGGLTEEAGYTVKITRRAEWGPIPLPGSRLDPTGRFYVAEVRLKDVMEAQRPEDNVLILPHDVLSVPRAEMVYVIGSVGTPGGFVLKEKETISALQALALAGGLEKPVKAKHARILRPIGDSGNRTEIPLNLRSIMAGKAPDVPLQAEDILFVPKSTGKAAAVQAARTSVSVATGLLVWRVGR